ncbi:xylosidase/arabinosidase [Colletotrichum costaricense]|uniref:Xylosidase/arabinosidase n=1 Tax=Colletotrichum costaricense TaxID=1209916 RepID=A0AAJ0E6U4_9PEZI|nr:xylosidase/arabinosidase [Colletotrichum costaricense]KAK1538771.1 xylosidase/arabinosidase [Colletotrichum costaricense]
MQFLRFISFVSCPLGVLGSLANTSYTNPIIPGWHSDPSCAFVPEWNETLFCTTSSFITFPGNPVYASKDLIDWKLASNAVNRVSQFPLIRNGSQGEDLGMFASTLRYNNGTFYLISTWVSAQLGGPKFVIFTTKDPFDDLSWSDAIWPETPGDTIDPDIFFDDGGSVIVASSGTPIKAVYLDLSTGNTSEPWDLWNGTGGANAEGPHVYKKDGYYYLLIAEGGTQLNHSATIARSKSIKGPWEAAPHNPLVSNRGTKEYFQTVGHADLFQDSAGNWWGVALSTRGGPDLYNSLNYPMGRETVLFPVSWLAGGWPIADTVRGNMSGPLPNKSSVQRGVGPLVGEADVEDFKPGSTIPSHWVYWRAPFNASYFTVSPQGHENALQMTASRTNLTRDAVFNVTTEGVTSVFRRQEHTFFNFTVDIELGFGKSVGDEVGVSNYVNPNQHVDLGIIYQATVSDKGDELEPYFQLRARSINNSTAPDPKIVPIPQELLGRAIRIRISPRNETHNEFFGSSADHVGSEQSLWVFNNALLAGDGATTGGLLGVYATTNGGNGSFNGYVGRWRYEPIGQKVDYNVFVPTSTKRQ